MQSATWTISSYASKWNTVIVLAFLPKGSHVALQEFEDIEQVTVIYIYKS